VVLPLAADLPPPPAGPKNLQFWDEYSWEDILHKHPTYLKIPASLNAKIAHLWKTLTDAINEAHDNQPDNHRLQERLWKLMLATPQLIFHHEPHQKGQRHNLAKTIGQRISLWHDGAWAILQPPYRPQRPPSDNTPTSAKTMERTVKQVCSLLQDNEIARALQRIHQPTSLATDDKVQEGLPNLFPRANTAWPHTHTTSQRRKTSTKSPQPSTINSTT
jgi:hypothetical protein